MNIIKQIQAEQTKLIEDTLSSVEKKIESSMAEVVHMLSRPDGELFIKDLETNIVHMEDRYEKISELIATFEEKVREKEASIKAIDLQMALSDDNYQLVDIPDIRAKYLARYKHDIERLEEEEQQARKRLLVSMY